MATFLFRNLVTLTVLSARDVQKVFICLTNDTKLKFFSQKRSMFRHTMIVLNGSLKYVLKDVKMHNGCHLHAFLPQVCSYVKITNIS